MSEKRFTMKYSFEDEEYVFYDKNKALSPSEVRRLLNDMIEDNEELRKENEVLKKVCEMYSSATRSDREYIKEFEEENGKIIIQDEFHIWEVNKKKYEELKKKYDNFEEEFSIFYVDELSDEEFEKVARDSCEY